MERGKDTINREQNEGKFKSRNKLRVEKGPLKIRNEQNTWKLQSRKRKMESDTESVHTNEARQKNCLEPSRN